MLLPLLLMLLQTLSVVVDGRYVGFVPGRRGVRSQPDLYAGLKERSQVKSNMQQNLKQVLRDLHTCCTTVAAIISILF